MKDLLPHIISRLDKSKIKYEIHSFDPGAVMVDIFIADKFYVVQIDGDQIGLSLVTDKTLLFDIIPDKSYKDTNEFKNEFEKIFLSPDT